MTSDIATKTQACTDPSDLTMTEDPLGTSMPDSLPETRNGENGQIDADSISAVPEEYLTNRRDLESHLDMPELIKEREPSHYVKSPPGEGQLVFSPEELNQSGEDKEYFHPKDHHRFAVPKDANSHALKPDLEMSPDNKMVVIPVATSKPE